MFFSFFLALLIAMVGCGGKDGGGSAPAGGSTATPGLLLGIRLNLSNNAGGSFEPNIVISGSTVLVTWYDDTPGNKSIFLARSIDGGASFSAPVNLSNNAGVSFSPRIAIFGSTVLVTWGDDTGNADIFLARSTNGGATFSAPVNLSNNTEPSLAPDMAISGSTVLITWQDRTPGNYDIFLAQSTDGGANFSAAVNLSNNAGHSSNPHMAISDSTVLVTWNDNTPGNNDVFLARSTDGGATFSALVNLSNDAGFAGNPQMAISGSTALVTWEAVTSGSKDIFMARSTDGGMNFSAPVNLSSDTGDSSNPQIAMSGSTVWVTWYNPISGTMPDIFMARSTDGGTNFSASVNLSNNARISGQYHIAISGSIVLVTWYDTTPGNADIFLARLE